MIYEIYRSESRLRKGPGRLLLFICLGALLTIVTKAQSQSQPQSELQVAGRGAEAILATPVQVVGETFTDWTADSAFLYWADSCSIIGRGASASQSPAATYLLERAPINGGVKRLLDISQDADCVNYQFMTSDTGGIYYYNRSDSQIEKIAVGSSIPQFLATMGANDVSTPLKIKDGYLYFGTVQRDIMRVSVTGGTPEFIVKSTGIPNDLEFLGETIYWTDSAGVWSAPIGCNGCTEVQYSDKPGVYLTTASGGNLAQGGGVYWVVRGNGTTTADVIYERIPIINGVADMVKFSAPIGYKIGDPIIVKSGFIQTTFNFYWTESHGTSQNSVQRNGTTIGVADNFVSPKVFVLNSDVYFATTGSSPEAIWRLPANAEALTRDMEISAIEVTQAVQNLENSVTLIADKATYVRVYGTQSSGIVQGGAEAWLEGTRNGQPLPGSPLRAINGIQPLVTGAAIDRGPDPSAQGDWLFELPASWDDQGSIVLTATVDPRQAYDDPNLTNNTKSTQLLPFKSQSDPCLFLYPVLTHEPLPTLTDPAFWDNIDRMETLWPINGLKLYGGGEPIRELELCWDWDGHCWGPYEMDQGSSATNFPSDSDRVLIKLMMRQSLSRVEGLFYCGASASIHTVGMVKEGSSENGNGYANFSINASWVQFESEDPTSSKPWNEPRTGSTLAQELMHNFWEYHIGCKGAEDSIFGFASWPYNDRCKLDDRPLFEPTTYFGFDPISQQIISPDLAGDFMTYSDNRWVSNVMYERVRDDLQVFGRAPAAAAAEPQVGNSIMVNGVYQAATQTGKLLYSYVLPNDMLTNAHSGAIPADPPVDPRAAAVPHDHSTHLHTEATPLAVARILGANNLLLAQHDLDLISPDNHDDPFASYYFLNQFPEPEGTVVNIQLIVDGKLIDEIVPSSNLPVVDIVSPTVNETLGDTITIRWRGSDADGDVLLYSVIYSPDNGESWVPLVTEHPGDVVNGIESAITSLTLESPEMLAGSDGNVARLRVVASDGFNTTFDEVGPFTVPNRPPVAIIQSPNAGEAFDPTRPIILRGLGYDAEAGLMDGERVEWTVSGEVIGTGRQQTLIGLAPGSHLVSLKVTDSIGQIGQAERVINVLPLTVDDATFVKLDGRCHDSAYVAATPLPLSVYTKDGGNASAYFLRRGDDLWVCMSGLGRTQDEISKADLYLDPDGSGGNIATSGDYLFRLGEDGSPQLFVGNGSGGFVASSTIAFSGQIAATEGAWSAEWHIPASSLSLWTDSFRMAVSHANQAETEVVLWPHAADRTSPQTWAKVAPEAVPFIQSLSTSELTVGDQAVVLEVDGVNFGNDATLLWDGVAQTTEVSGTTHLTIPVGSPLLQTAGTIQLTVVNSNPGDFPSNKVVLTVKNQVPLISALSPSAIESGAAATTVTITGQKFVAGSVVQWDGEARPTRFINGATLEVDLTAADLSEAQAFGITVQPPEPRQGSSNTAVLVVGDPNQPARFSSRVYLPLIIK